MQLHHGRVKHNDPTMLQSYIDTKRYRPCTFVGILPDMTELQNTVMYIGRAGFRSPKVKRRGLFTPI